MNNEELKQKGYDLYLKLDVLNSQTTQAVQELNAVVQQQQKSIKEPNDERVSEE